MNLEGRVVNVLKKLGMGVAIVVISSPVVVGGGFIGLAGVASLLGRDEVLGHRIIYPSTPPRVELQSNAIRIESQGYVGPHLTKNFLTGEIKVEWFQPDFYLDLFTDFPEYIDRDGDGLVDSVGMLSWTGHKEYEREKDLAQNPDVFARADRELEEVLDKYRPYIAKVEERSQF